MTSTATGRGRPRGALPGALAVACLVLLAGLSPSSRGAPGAEADRTSSLRRIAVVRAGTLAQYRETAAEIDRLLGGRNHRVDVIDLEDLPTVGEKIRRAEIVVAVGTQAAATLRRTVAASRLVYCLVADPDAAGLSGSRGITTEVPAHRQFALMARAIPSTRTVGALYRSKNARSRAILARGRAGLPRGWTLSAVDVDRHESVADAITTLTRSRPDVVWIAPDSAVYDAAIVRGVLLQTIRRRIPVFGYSASCVRAGTLLGTVIDPRTQARQAADLVRRILRKGAATAPSGATPPVFRVAVNTNTARALRLRLSPEFLKSCDMIVGRRGR